MSVYFGIWYERRSDDGAPRYGVVGFEAENLAEALKFPVHGNPALDVIESHKFERLITSLTFPAHPVDYYWAYLPHQQTFRGLGYHPDEDPEELKDQAIADYGDGITQDVLIFDASLALMFLENAVSVWKYRRRLDNCALQSLEQENEDSEE